MSSIGTERPGSPEPAPSSTAFARNDPHDFLPYWKEWVPGWVAAVADDLRNSAVGTTDVVFAGGYFRDLVEEMLLYPSGFPEDRVGVARPYKDLDVFVKGGLGQAEQVVEMFTAHCEAYDGVTPTWEWTDRLARSSWQTPVEVIWGVDFSFPTDLLRTFDFTCNQIALWPCTCEDGEGGEPFLWEMVTCLSFWNDVRDKRLCYQPDVPSQKIYPPNLSRVCRMYAKGYVPYNTTEGLEYLAQGAPTGVVPAIVRATERHYDQEMAGQRRVFEQTLSRVREQYEEQIAALKEQVEVANRDMFLQRLKVKSRLAEDDQVF